MRYCYKKSKCAEIVSRLTKEQVVFDRLLKELTLGFKEDIFNQFVNRYNKTFDTIIDSAKYSIVWDGVILTIESILESRIIFIYGPNGGHKPTFFQYKKPHVASRLFNFWDDLIFRNDISDEKFPYDLPPDPLYCILRFLPIKDRLNCRCVSKHWRRVATMDRTWGNCEFGKFVKSAVLLNSLNVEETLVKEIGLLENIAKAWAFEHGLIGARTGLICPRKFEEEPEPKQKKMKILMTPNVPRITTVYTIAGVRIKAYAAGLVNHQAVVWIDQTGELKLCDHSTKVSKKNTLEKLRHMMLNYFDDREKKI